MVETYRLCNNIQDAVEDSLRVRRNDVSSLTDTPGNGVEQPHGECYNTANEVDSVHVGTKSLGMIAAITRKLVEDSKHGGAANGEEAFGTC